MPEIQHGGNGMSRNGAGVYSLPEGYLAVSGETILASQHNSPLEDLRSDANTARPIVAGGTGATSAVGGHDAFSTKGSAIASATTTDIGAATGMFVHITGTTTITGFGTKTAGVKRIVIFDGILTLTHNATSLILPGGANITTAAGDAAVMVSEGSGNWRCVSYVAAASLGGPDASTSQKGVVELATDGEVYAATAGKAIDAGKIESASAAVALSDGAPVAVDWDAGINFDLTVTANRQIANPTNGQPRTWRTIVVQGDDSTDRTITFGDQYLGDVPTITDCDDGKWYLLSIFCVSASHFVVMSQVAKKP